MREPELRLDPDIRFWVFIPIVIITFLVGITRHYVSGLMASPKKANFKQIRDSQILIRARLLRENGRFLPRQAFLMRKHFFNENTSLSGSGQSAVTHQGDSQQTNANGGLLRVMERQAAKESETAAAASGSPFGGAGGQPNMLTDPSAMTEMLKGNLTNVLPMIVIGGWINWHFSGFVTTKVPFPLTLRFKPMLQRGIELMSLDASWVSSASWYFLNVFGLRSIYALVLGENNAADQSRIMQEQMSTSAANVPQDTKNAFKAEWEALEMTDHRFALKNVDKELETMMQACIDQHNRCPEQKNSMSQCLPNNSQTHFDVNVNPTMKKKIQ